MRTANKEKRLNAIVVDVIVLHFDPKKSKRSKVFELFPQVKSV